MRDRIQFNSFRPPPMDPILSQVIAAQTFVPHFCEITSKMNSSSTANHLELHHIIKFCNQNFHVSHMLLLCDPPTFVQALPRVIIFIQFPPLRLFPRI